MTPGLKPRYDLAIDAARKAGVLAKTYYDTAFEVEWKADLSPVTVADKAAERLIRDMVAEHFPGDGFLGEEYGYQAGTTGYRWVLDPIDGTKSFIRHIPLWGTLVGLEYRGDQVAGAAYVPCLDILYHAARGHGAYRDAVKIGVSKVSELSEAFLCYSSIGWFKKAGKADMFLDLSSKTGRQRGYGDFYGFVLVAEGAVDLMIDHSVSPWDVAAVVPIIEEAGGKFTNWSGERTIHTPDVFASNGLLHDGVLKVLTA